MRPILLMLLVAFALSACGTPTTSQSAEPTGTPLPTNTGPARPSEPIPIEAVDIRIAESNPVQVIVTVQGTLPDGCHVLDPITQEREGNTITINVTSHHTGADVCTLALVMINEQVTLQGDFPPGDYIVRVNDTEKAFTV